MRLTKLVLLAAALMSLRTQAETNPNILNVAFGAGVPVDTTGQTLTEADGASRTSGGEHFILKLATPKPITDIKIASFSASHLGKNLIHSVTGLSDGKSVAIPQLYQFKSVTMGNPQNSGGLVMLADNQFVEAVPNQPFSQLDIVIEGYSNDDTAFLLSVSSSDSLNADQFLLSRTGPHKDVVLGALLDESAYAKFTPEQLAHLMTISLTPAAADLAGHAFVCTSYSKLDGADVDQKSRAYTVDGNGALISQSDLEGNVAWTSTADGLAAGIQNQNGCGTYASSNIIRRTPSGNLIAEVVVELEAYVALCERAGYDADGTRAVETDSTFASILNPKYVVDSYEFCRLAQ